MFVQDQYGMVYRLVNETLRTQFYPIPREKFAEEAQRICETDQNILRKQFNVSEKFVIFDNNKGKAIDFIIAVSGAYMTRLRFNPSTLSWIYF